MSATTYSLTRPLTATDIKEFNVVKVIISNADTAFANCANGDLLHFPVSRKDALKVWASNNGIACADNRGASSSSAPYGIAA